MSAATPAAHRGTDPQPFHSRVRASRRSLLIAFAIALLIHLGASIALTGFDWQPPTLTAPGEHAAAPLAFELLPTPATKPTPAPPAEVPPKPPAEDAAELAPEPAPEPESISASEPESKATLEPTRESPPARAVQTEPDQTSAAAPATTDTTPSSAARSTAPSEDRPSALDSLAGPPARAVSAADILASRDQALAGLTQHQLRRQPGAAPASRRKAISASTQEYIYANYLESWRRKVERIGNLNYPEEAKEKHLFGSLVLQVAVRADGSLESVRVLRSSGHDVLDQAAVRIVELAAPFAPFPKDIRARHDVLDITRTWQFLRNQKLGWDQ
ncbi:MULTISPECIES: TonB family protein [Thiorhodovibrio]|uniref:TonB family protein n=1 Tax=Thiorhodovibrio TaxID=61593 RepID=UPI0019146598|nr:MULTISPECIES: TonB family protein [Thiorhodovibrio]MBK5967765.1 hypothetical protein [Thiorhodovibrio winogradskyi]WPL14430.1 hypothetical protein Thiosp_04276 [Thiorhodovibrio litoralis]